MMGRPRVPFPSESFDELRKLLEQSSQVVEAQLPTCLVPKLVEPPQQVLVVCLHEGGDEVPRDLLSAVYGKWPAHLIFRDTDNCRSPETRNVAACNMDRYSTKRLLGLK